MAWTKRAKTHYVELKPCPFCGSEAELKSRNPWGKYFQFHVICSSCKARVPDKGGIDAEQRAVASWNVRAGERKNEEVLQAGISHRDLDGEPPARHQRSVHDR